MDGGTIDALGQSIRKALGADKLSNCHILSKLELGLHILPFPLHVSLGLHYLSAILTGGDNLGDLLREEIFFVVTSLPSSPHKGEGGASL